MPSFASLFWRLAVWLIERLLETGLAGIVVAFVTIFFHFSNQPERLDGSVFQNMLAVSFGAGIFYFISLYGVSCILFGLVFRNPTPSRHANIMVTAFCVHVIGYFLFVILYDLYMGGMGLDSPKQVLRELLPLLLLIGASGIPAVWVGNYVGGIFDRWARARFGKTTWTS